MRAFFLALLCLASPVSAWEFTPFPICTLFHQGEDIAVAVTYDPSLPEYSIQLSREAGWPAGDVFSMQFQGSRTSVISTNRHVIDPDDPRTLIVRDRGFRNVLNGLQFNTRAIANIGGLSIAVSLIGAAPLVIEFRACPADQLVNANAEKHIGASRRIFR